MGLREQIMNIKVESNNIQLLNNDIVEAYKIGHYDGKYAAAELATKVDARIEELESALRNLLNGCINFDGGKLTDCIMEKAATTLKAKL